MASQVDEDFAKLLLVGMDGDGKSSTGNTIFGREKFPVKKTSTCQGTAARVQEYNLCVVDSPGLVRTGSEVDIRSKIRLILDSQPDGFDAILIVMRYGRKLTQGDRLLIEMLEALFGPDYVKERVIIVTTHADKYKPKYNYGLSLENFIEQQPGLLQEMREKCNNRLIAFDNKTRDESVRHNQVRRLLDMVAEMRKHSDRYSLGIFGATIKERIESTLQREKSTCEKSRASFLNFLQDLENIPLESFSIKQLREIHANLKEYRQELTDLIPRISKLEDNIIAQFEGLQKKTEPGSGGDEKESGHLKQDMSADDHEDFTSFLLVGKTGYGKSATCNSILGVQKFKSGSFFTSTTKKCQREVARVHGRAVIVVDSPSLADTDIKEDDGKKLLEDEVNNILTIQPDGFDAILVVILFQHKLTEEDRGVFLKLTKLFGQDYVRMFGMLVITFADEYDPEENENLPFEQFMKSQKGLFLEVLQSCNNRMVVFDNKTKDETIRKNQRNHLLDMVAKMKSCGQRYTPELFKKARKSRGEAYLNAELPVIRQNTKDKLKIIRDDIANLSHNCRDISRFEQHLTKLKKLEKELIEQDRNTGVLQELLSAVEKLIRDLKACIELIRSKDHGDKNEELKRLNEQLQNNNENLSNQLQSARETKKGVLSKVVGAAVGTVVTAGVCALAASILHKLDLNSVQEQRFLVISAAREQVVCF